MARKIKASPPGHAPVSPPQDAAPVRVVTPTDIVPEGDYAGMRYDDVLALTSQMVDEAYANLSIEGACTVHDMKLKEIMEIVQYVNGPGAAHEAAIRFGQTLMPYLNTPAPRLRKAYGELLRLRNEWERGEDE